MSKEDNIDIKNRLETALNNKEIYDKALIDFCTTFSKVGLNKSDALDLAKEVLSLMKEKQTLEQSEKKMLELFNNIFIKKIPFLVKLNQGLRGREKIIISQVRIHLNDIKGKVLDFGAGSGKVAQGLKEELGLDIECVDIRNFKEESVTIPFKIYDGKTVPVNKDYYEAAIMTNVAHHEKNNEIIIKELTRIVKRRLVIIETVPENESVQEWERTFINDTLWNRFFNYADIPVPGTYELPAGWIKRFTKYGWKLVKSESLGYDQPTIQDLHHMFVFER